MSTSKNDKLKDKNIMPINSEASTEEWTEVTSSQRGKKKSNTTFKKETVVDDSKKILQKSKKEKIGDSSTSTSEPIQKEAKKEGAEKKKSVEKSLSDFIIDCLIYLNNKITKSDPKGNWGEKEGWILLKNNIFELTMSELLSTDEDSIKLIKDIFESKDINEENHKEFSENLSLDSKNQKEIESLITIVNSNTKLDEFETNPKKIQIHLEKIF